MSFGQPRTSEQAGGDKQSWDRRTLLARRYAPPTEQTKMVPCLRATKGRPYGGMAVCGVGAAALGSPFVRPASVSAGDQRSPLRGDGGLRRL